jgi:hypothetical protein
VKRDLRRGRPQVGYVAWKVVTHLKIAEAEESDDESEGDEDAVMKLEVRNRRRIVDFELRLDV